MGRSYRESMRQTRLFGALAALVAGATLTMAPPAAATTPTTTVLTSSLNPSTSGQAVTLTAVVTGSAPAGQVAFGELGVTIGIADLTAGGTATLVVSSLSVGDHALTATYAGDGTNDASAGALTQTVVAPPTPTATHTHAVKRPRVTLVASKREAEVGDKVVLRWHTRHAETVTASGDWGGSQKSKGSATLRVTERGKHVFKLTVRNAAGAKTAKVVVMASRKAKELELVVTDELTEIGTDVEVTADGLAKGEDYTIRLDEKVILTGQADKHGDVSRTFEVPKGTPQGEVPLSITGSNPNRVGSAVLNVIGATKLEVTVGAAKIDKREEQTLSVTGLLPGEVYTVTLDGEKLTSGTADEAGEFTYEFRVGKPLGKQTITVTGVIESRVGTATYIVRDPGRGPNNGG